MTSKSQRSRDKHLSRRKRAMKRQVTSVRATRELPGSQVDKSVSQPKVSAPSSGKPTPMATQVVARYPYITTELRRIGILGGIILVILVVLYLTLT